VPGTPPTSTAAASERIRSGLEDSIAGALAEARARVAELDPSATILVDEIGRLVAAGGKRLRPLFCVLGYRASGGDPTGAIVRAASALELLHTMALIHDDVMDESDERRGVASTHRHLSDEARRAGGLDPERTGRSLAILTGDLAAVLADRLFLGSGFPASRLVEALGIYAEMRIEMAAGQALDVLGPAASSDPGRVARMRGGSYTVAGPLAIGAALGAARPEVRRGLAAYGEPLGEAFQLVDDLRDADRGRVDRSRVRALVVEATTALDPVGLPADVDAALRNLAEEVGDGW
jgi:geranylgeranyl diphosphate synthase type I